MLALIRNGVTYQLNMDDLLKRGQNLSNIYLQVGDAVRVASREDSGVYVMGEVNKPATITPMRNGSLTLSQAISTAAASTKLRLPRGNCSRSETPRANRRRSITSTQASPVSMILANQFELQPKDVVYVGQGGLVRFNRILNLLLPAINAAVTGVVGEVSKTSSKVNV